MPSALFNDITQWEFTWQGHAAKLPVFYYDNLSLTAIYTADTAAIRERLPHPMLKPLELYPGRALVAFTAFEYRETDIDPYNEFSIAFLVTANRYALVGAGVTWALLRRCYTAYVWQLPVTTERARAGGVDWYGYPKFLADIRFERDAAWMGCELRQDGVGILTLHGRVLDTSRGRRTRIVTYSFRDGIPLKTNIVQDPIEFAQSAKRDAARLEIGRQHAIGAELGQLGLSQAPVLYQLSPRFEAILFPGRNLLDA